MDAIQFFKQKRATITKWVMGKTICDRKIDNLQISRDFDDTPDKPHAVMLFTPHMDDTNEHHHICLTNDQARALRDWLNDYLRR